MKKRLFAALIAVVMIVSVLPFTVSAAAADHGVKVELVKASDSTMRLDFYYKSGTELPKSQMIHLKYDTNVLYPVMNGRDVTANLKNLSTNWAKNMTSNNYVTPELPEWEGFGVASPSEVILYGIVQDGIGYFIWKVEETEAESMAEVVAMSDYTLISSLTLGVREGVDFNNFPAEAISFSDPKEDFAVTSAQQIVDVWTKDGKEYQYGPRTGEGTLPAPEFVAGEGVKFAGSEPEVPEAVSVAAAAEVADGKLVATATVNNTFKAGTNGLVIVAAYTADGLVKVASKPVALTEVGTESATLTLDDYADVTEVKAFYWDGYANRTPLCASDVAPVAQ